MYNELNNNDTREKQYKRERKPVRMSDLVNDAKEISEYIRFFEKNPKADKWQIHKHLLENDVLMSLLDNRINDCEHVIAMKGLAVVDEETVRKAHEILAETLELRIRLKRHRQECLDRIRDSKQPLDGDRKYYVRTLKKEFGNAITIEQGRAVFHTLKESC